MKNKKSKQLSVIYANFHKIFYRDVVPFLQKKEDERVALLRKVLKRFLFMILSLSLSFLSLLFSEQLSLYSIVLAALFFFCAIVLLVNASTDIQIFNKSLKYFIYSQVLSIFGDIKWKKNSLDSETQKINESNLFAKFDNFVSFDSFKGCYKGVNYLISELELIYEGSVNVFKGVILNFPSNKNIKNNTIIVSKNEEYFKNTEVGIIRWIFSNWYLFLPIFAIALFIGSATNFSMFFIFGFAFLFIIPFLFLFYYSSSDNISQFEQLNEIKLESVDFAKRFKAYSSDEVEGRYLLTTTFLERFTNLQNAFGARNVKCSFYNDDIMFALSTHRNLFEIGNIFTPLTTTKHMKRFFDELSSVMEMIEYFKLDEKTGL